MAPSMSFLNRGEAGGKGRIMTSNLASGKLDFWHNLVNKLQTFETNKQKKPFHFWVLFPQRIKGQEVLHAGTCSSLSSFNRGP